MHRLHTPPRATIALSAILLLGDCTRWQMESSPVGLAESKPKAVRAERRDGSVVELVRVDRVEDSLTGLVPKSAPGGAPLSRVTVPFQEITSVASQRNDTRRTIIAVLAAPLAYLATRLMVRW